MTDPDKIDTLEKARAMSLTKWANVAKLASKLFYEINNLCGFCYFRDAQTDERIKCSKCVVNKYCYKLQKRMMELEAEFQDEIDRTISFIKKVKV